MLEVMILSKNDPEGFYIESFDSEDAYNTFCKEKNAVSEFNDILGIYVCQFGD